METSLVVTSFKLGTLNAPIYFNTGMLVADCEMQLLYPLEMNVTLTLKVFGCCSNWWNKVWQHLVYQPSLWMR